MATTYPNLTKAFIRSSIGIVIFLIVAAMGTGCMTTTLNSGEAGVRYSPFGGTDLNAPTAKASSSMPPGSMSLSTACG